MGSSVNKVFLMGNLTRDPQLNHLPSGSAVADFGMAVSERYKKSNSDEWVEKTTFIDVTAFARTAEVVSEYLHKGSKVFIEGKLQLDQWEDKKTGEKRSRLKVIIDSLTMLDQRSGHSGGQRSSTPANQQSDVATYNDASVHDGVPTDEVPF